MKHDVVNFVGWEVLLPGMKGWEIFLGAMDANNAEPEWDPGFRAQVSNMPYTGEVVYRTTTNTLWRTDAS